MSSHSGSEFSWKACYLWFFNLGATCFGGPVALLNRMQAELVDKRQWFTQTEFNEGLTLSKMAPGPLATQLAIYLGWLKGGVKGATAVGFFFILPSFLMVVAISILYVHFGRVNWMTHTFYGVGSAAIALVGISAFRFVHKTVPKDLFLIVITIASAGMVFFSESESVLLILLAGFLFAIYKALQHHKNKILSSFALPVYFGPIALISVDIHLYKRIFIFFLGAGSMVFGSGLAIVPFLHTGVVTEFKWLTEQQFLDAVAIAMVTPGPLVITSAFIGYLVGGLFGSIVAALGTFLPCYLIVIFIGPWFKRIQNINFVKNAVLGITVAAAGAILGGAALMAQKSIHDITGIVMCLLALFIFLKFKSVPEPVVILGFGILGVLSKMILY